jgi:putative thioredoxin
MTVIDVTDATFQAEVLDRSREVPVVVDFWAEWCQPCRMLGPIIERAATAREGKVVLAKLDTDANQQTAGAFRIQGIPAVKAFKGGEVVSEFTGAQPPAVVERFFDTLVPSEAELLTGAGDEASLRKALELEPSRADAVVALARIVLERGELDEAEEIAGRAPGNFQADGLAARIRLVRRDDPDLDPAWKALDAGEHEQAIDVLIGALPSADGAKDDIRQAVVAVLDELGVDHPLARDARRRLAAALY